MMKSEGSADLESNSECDTVIVCAVEIDFSAKQALECTI